MGRAGSLTTEVSSPNAAPTGGGFAQAFNRFASKQPHTPEAFRPIAKNPVPALYVAHPMSVKRSSMRRRHHSFKERVLAILERVVEQWSRAFIYFVLVPTLDPKRLQTKEDVDDVERHLFRTVAHLSRAIYKTARRLVGLPRLPCPIENFYRPKLKSARHIRWLYLNCTHKLRYSRRLAIRMAWRWKRVAERRARDPLCDLRGDITEFPHHNFAPSAEGRGRWIARPCELH
jgi:hypothetical protein